jgi:endogenous inhibitor of DNA gyrase (YacG/DUF329 family)
LDVSRLKPEGKEYAPFCSKACLSFAVHFSERS